MKKIMFNDKYHLTESVLSGIKTQTRRLIKINEQILNDFNIEYYNNTLDVIEDKKELIKTYIDNNPSKLPYHIGDVIAIAQSYSNCGYKCYPYRDTDEYMFIYENDRDIPISPAGVNNKMFVSAKLMPHQIRITNIRIERLQDISDEDCLAEGILEWNAGQKDIPFFTYKNAKKNDFDCPRDAYASLIDKISGKGTWEKNPLVYVFEFVLLK